LTLNKKNFVILEELKPRRKSSTPRDELADTQFESFDSGAKEKTVQPVTEMEVSPDISLGTYSVETGCKASF
jgi:hypothetical protein